MPEQERYTERDLEKRLLDNLGHFLLEMGKGFVLIRFNLKLGKVNHQNIRQMNLYLNYFKEEENTEDDNPPIGIVLAADKDQILVDYATGSISNQLFVSKYLMYIPEKKQLEEELRHLLNQETSNHLPSETPPTRSN